MKVLESYEDAKVRKKLDIDIIKEFSIADKKEIRIEADTANVKLILVKGEKVKVHLYGYVSKKKNEPDFEILNANKEVDIIVTSSKPVITIMKPKVNIKLDVYIPERYENALVVKSSTGDLFVDSLKVKTFERKSGIGKTKIGKVESEKIKMESDLGNFTIEKLYGKNIELKASSGSIMIEEVQGEVDVKGGLGDIELGYNKFNDNINIDGDMGKVKLFLPKEAEFKLESDTSMGNFKSDFKIITFNSEKKDDQRLRGYVGSTDKLIKIKTSLGNISIVKNN